MILHLDDDEARPAPGEAVIALEALRVIGTGLVLLLKRARICSAVVWDCQVYPQ